MFTRALTRSLTMLPVLLGTCLAALILAPQSAAALDYPMLRSMQPKTDAEKAEATLLQAQPQRYLDKPVDEATYLVGPGDVFYLDLFDAGMQPQAVEVLPEGGVLLPGVGMVQLGKITLKEAKQHIREALSTRYRDRSIDVSLARPRFFKVAVTGAVQKPGMVVVSASDRVTEALTLASGLLPRASQRRIKLFSSSGDTVNADLSYFHATGRTEMNPYLNEGLVIFVPVVSDSFNKVEIYGAVNAPGIFEFKPGDRISDLIALGFGLAVDADLDDGELVRFGEGQAPVSQKVDLRGIAADPNSNSNLALQPDDRLFVRSQSSFRPKQRVYLVGEVRFPGFYPIQPGCRTVSELITKAGGILPSASLPEAEMYRATTSAEEKTSFDRLVQLEPEKLSDFELQYLKETSARRPGKVAVDFQSLLSGNKQEHDIPLFDGDWIRIPPRSYSVEVLGRVVNPGIVPYRDNARLEDYIRLAGGYGYKADKSDIRIIKANTGAVIKAERTTEVAMGDRIMVPQKKGANVWGFVKDAGLLLANLATVYIVIDQAVNR